MIKKPLEGEAGLASQAWGEDLAPANAIDPVVEVYKTDVDRTILRENLRLSPQQRSEKFMAFMKSIYELRESTGREPSQ
jgi:hypothetical protein